MCKFYEEILKSCESVQYMWKSRELLDSDKISHISYKDRESETYLSMKQLRQSFFCHAHLDQPTHPPPTNQPTH